MSERTGARDPFKDLFEQATDQDKELARARAAMPNSNAPISRERACLGGLILTAPLLALLILVNVWAISPIDLITPNPPPDVARQLAKGVLDGVVQGIESFRHDYETLPKELVEVGVPQRGSWTYSLEPGGRYHVSGTMYGQVVRFDSPEGAVDRERHR